MDKNIPLWGEGEIRGQKQAPHIGGPVLLWVQLPLVERTYGCSEGVEVIENSDLYVLFKIGIGERVIIYNNFNEFRKTFIIRNINGELISLPYNFYLRKNIRDYPGLFPEYVTEWCDLPARWVGLEILYTVFYGTVNPLDPILVKKYRGRLVSVFPSIKILSGGRVIDIDFFNLLWISCKEK